MSQRSEPIERFMSASPHCIGSAQSMRKAHEMMREHRIRHLPVLEGGKLVGMVSERDLLLVQSLPGANADDLPVEEAMSQDVFSVAPEDSLNDVAKRMAEEKIGSAVVLKENRVVGVFTTIDALRALV